jgi:hypothetical protein
MDTMIAPSAAATETARAAGLIEVRLADVQTVARDTNV